MLSAAVPGRRRAAAGFTLIELAVGLAVMGLLVAVTVPGAVEWVRNLQVRSTTESLRAGLERARLDALKNNRAVSFWLIADDAAIPGSACAVSNTGRHWVISVKDPAGKCNEDVPSADPLLVARSEALSGASRVTVAAVDSTDKDASRVIFNTLGQVVNADAINRITIKPASGTARELQIRVESGGAIRSCDPKVSSSDPRACP